MKYRKKREEHILEKDRLSFTFQQTLLSAQLEIQEQTLKNISQEIHDNIGQILSLAKLNLARADIKQGEIAQQRIDDSKNLVAKAIQDLRDLSKSLNTDYVADMGLARSIEYQLEIIKKTGSFGTGLEIEGDVYRLEQQKELILFRIVQEVMNNIIKHAKATRIEVKMEYQRSYFALKIMDNGQGFVLNSFQDSNETNQGLGIRNMRNRALLIGAQFSIESTLTQGTFVNIQLPISNQVS